jgi:bifunctional non-homologous end joining protein LigD
MEPRNYSPEPLERRREPFDHPDWLYELKWDGFRTLAHVTGGGSILASRNGNASVASLTLRLR